MALADSLHGLLRLPGATYSCVVERDSGRVLAEAGHGESGAGDGEGVVSYSVARWGTAVAAMFDSTSGDALDDVMITGRRSYHLVRPLGPTASVLVYLRLDRARSNLAAARRELAGVRWGAGAPPDAGAEARTAAGASRSVPRPGRPGDEAAAARASPGGASGPAAGTTPGGTERTLSATPAEGGGARTSRRAATASRPDSASRPESARPQIPLPRRAPVARASDPGERRRAAGRPSDPGESARPDGFVVPAVLGQSWAHDPGTLRRLIAGLRRLG